MTSRSVRPSSTRKRAIQNVKGGSAKKAETTRQAKAPTVKIAKKAKIPKKAKPPKKGKTAKPSKIAKKGKTAARSAHPKPRRTAWHPMIPPPEEKRRARRINKALARAYPDARISLRFTNPLELYVATVLSAQCTDERVNKVTPDLFSKLRAAKDYARIPRARLQKMIQPTGFFRNKAKMIQEACRVVVKDFGGDVPRTMEELCTLPGVGRKTANVILGNAFHTPGIVVDTHVRRLSNRMGFSAEGDPDRIEQDLMLRIPRKEWTDFSHRMIFHGRRICQARRPRCEMCPVRKDCPYPDTTSARPAV